MRPGRGAAPLWPALVVLTLLFGGGLLLALLQSVGLLPVVGRPHLGLEAYRAALSDPGFWRSLRLSLMLACTSTLLALGLGLGVALAVRRSNLAPLLLGLTLPLPHTVAALVTAGLLSQGGLLSRLTHALGLTPSPADFPVLVMDPRGLGVLIELTLKETPFAALAAWSALARLDPRLEAAARSLGANRTARFQAVLLPAVRPALLAAGGLIFAYALSSYEVPLLLGPTSPAPLAVEAYRASQDGDLTRRPLALALSLLLALVGGGVLWLWLRLERRA